ncbi:MAG: Hsp20/alpha crystallin family protein [Flavobacteriales bacterium]|nr:Hsp20/alpha crystallin family protein [Flavobacteriales bacterium]
MKYRPSNLLMTPFTDLINEYFGYDEAPNRLPSVNIVERAGEFRLDLLAPGYGKDELKLAVENDVLTISAEKKVEDLNENERYTRREYSYNAFTRSFRLPDTVNTEGIKAEFNNGVLHVSIPKREVNKPKSREISIG